MLQTSRISGISNSFATVSTVKYIIRKRALGDVLWIEPVIAALAAKNKKLIVHTKYNALFENYPFTNVTFKEKLSFFEKLLVRIEGLLGTKIVSINLDKSYEQNPTVHFLNAYQTKAGLPAINQYPNIFISEKEKKNRIIDGKYLVLHLESFASKPFRQIYGVDWTRVIEHLTIMGFKVVQIGVNDKPLPGAITVKTTLRELISLIYNCRFFIGLDSGPSHIAAALGKPAIIFFGAVNPFLRHFPDLFKGILVKQPCEYDGAATTLNYETLECTQTNKAGAPQCCIYTTDFVISKTDELLKRYAKEVD